MTFPIRILRSSLGPALQNLRPIRSPKYELGAERINDLEHTAIGCGLVVCRAYAIARYTGTWGIYDRAEAWNTDGSQTRPSLAQVGVGNYTWTFAESYLDGSGVAQTLLLIGARATAEHETTVYANRIESRAWVDRSNPRLVQMRFWDASGTLTDPERFLVEAW